MAALAIVIMCLGALIPVATYVCPMFCTLILQMVLRRCGVKIAWAWYGAVALLSVLLGPDKEAAAVFVFLGYYPILKPRLDRMKAGFLAKLALFNGATLLMYWLLLHLMGMEELLEEYTGMGMAMTAVLLVLGNITFFMLDFVLGRFGNRRRK